MIAETAKRNINDLSKSERAEYMRSVYETRSRFQSLFGRDQVEVDCAKYSEILRGEVTRLLLAKGLISEPVPLESLHECLSDEMRAYNFHDGVNKISTFFYETDAPFMRAYHEFIKEVLDESLLKMPMWFQATPTIRIHCPNAANSNHYPRYHTDIGYGHPPEEINVWLPLTRKMEGHSFRVASVAHSKDLYALKRFDIQDFIDEAIQNPDFTKTCDEFARPVETEFGKALLFDSRCVHTGEPLKAHTRVSIDLRLVPVEDFERAPFLFQGTGRRRVIFGPGHCYSDQSTETLNV